MSDGAFIVLVLLGMVACVLVSGWALRGARENGDLERLNDAVVNLGRHFRSILLPPLVRLAGWVERRTRRGA